MDGTAWQTWTKRDRQTTQPTAKEGVKKETYRQAAQSCCFRSSHLPRCTNVTTKLNEEQNQSDTVTPHLPLFNALDVVLRRIQFIFPAPHAYCQRPYIHAQCELQHLPGCKSTLIFSPCPVDFAYCHTMITSTWHTNAYVKISNFTHKCKDKQCRY